jgi:diguanylate cyclase (GGDEF)-like protein
MRQIHSVLTPPGWGFRLASACILAGALVLVSLAHLIAPVPFWLLLAILIAAWAITDFAYFLWPQPIAAWQLHSRFAIGTVAITAVMYMGGWGPAVMIGYIYLAADNMRSVGSRALWPGIFWAVVGTILGQIAIALGIAPSIIPPPFAHGLALLGLIGTCFGIYLVGSAVRQRERSEERLRQNEARLRTLAYQDALTGLPNRAFFMEQLETALDQAATTGNQPGVLFFGLDGFKLFNDSFGQGVGDAFLSAVGSLLQRNVRPGGLLARFGSDEFIVLLHDVKEPAAASTEAERLLALLRRPFVLDGGPRFLSASVGVALSAGMPAGASAEALVNAAGAAIHQAKRLGKGHIVTFAPDMTASARSRLDVETDLRQALARNQLILHYQPIVTLPDAKVVGVEALARWEHPRRGLIMPDQFIHLAEETELILPLGRRVLETACRQAHDWRESREAGTLASVSVNLSVRELRQPRLAEHVASVLLAAGIEPHNIQLEVTESDVMQDAEFSIATLRDLKSFGLRLAIDDFGTGYSSMSYLRHLPVDSIKIDQSLLSGLEDDLGAQAIVAAIIQLAHAIGMTVTAEGVETRGQAEWLGARGCDCAQGFFFYRPVPAAGITELLAVKAPAARA